MARTPPLLSCWAWTFLTTCSFSHTWAHWCLHAHNTHSSPHAHTHTHTNTPHTHTHKHSTHTHTHNTHIHTHNRNPSAPLLRKLQQQLPKGSRLRQFWNRPPGHPSQPPHSPTQTSPMLTRRWRTCSPACPSHAPSPGRTPARSPPCPSLVQGTTPEQHCQQSPLRTDLEWRKTHYLVSVCVCVLTIWINVKRCQIIEDLLCVCVWGGGGGGVFSFLHSFKSMLTDWSVGQKFTPLYCKSFLAMPLWQWSSTLV